MLSVPGFGPAVNCAPGRRSGATVLHRVKRVDRGNFVDRGRAEARDSIRVMVGRY